MGKLFGYIALLVSIAVVGLGGILGYFLLEGVPPRLEVSPIPKIIGEKCTFTVKATDKRSGLRSISALLSQKDKTVRLGSKTYKQKEWWRGSGVKEDKISWTIKPIELGLSQGEAILQICARDSSWRNGLKGNEQLWKCKVRIDITPPRIGLESTVHNIRTGGAGLVSYRVNKPISKTGVWIDRHFFPGYPKPGGKEGMYVAMVAIPFNVTSPKQVFIEAIDQAGNIAKAQFPYRILPKASRVRRIDVPDRFLEQKIPEFMARYPELKGSLPEVFLKINTEIRRRNNKEIRSYCKKSVPQILWHGRFERLPRSAFEAGFGDERHYFYRGKEIDREFHMGIDLASVAHAPIPAGNNGIVVFAGYLGIYGNTVILDHGLGLFSMYSHMNEIRVSVGDKVERGETMGITGMTGLAGGDHLHCGMLVSGVFVNPMEWWDQKWIQDHILANLAAK